MTAWMDAEETATYMRRSRDQVYKPDGKLLFRTSDVDKYITRRKA